MMRLRITNGRLTATQLATLAALSCPVWAAA